MTARAFRALLAVVTVMAAACATATPPAVAPAVPWRQPDVPRDFAGRARDVARYDAAWSLVRAGDLAKAEREFIALVTPAPGFYPAAASVGELRLRERQFVAAATFFEQALVANPKYVPALVGRVDAKLGAGDDAGALSALTALLAVEPNRAEAQARRDVVRLRVSQTELASADRARAAGQTAEAERHVARAREATPESSAVLRALSALALDRHNTADAVSFARQAVSLDGQDGAAWGSLGDALIAGGQFREAADAFARALAIEGRAEWRERRANAEDRARAVALPDAYRAIPTAARVTRAQVAAVLGVRLATALAAAPPKSSEVVTDVRGHWAATWILSVVRAGWMDARPNHTFDPAGAVTRADLARVVAAVLDAGPARSRPTIPLGMGFSDLPRDHAAFQAAQVAVAAGIMAADANRFLPAGIVTGSDLMAVIARLEARVK